MICNLLVLFTSVYIISYQTTSVACLEKTLTYMLIIQGKKIAFTMTVDRYIFVPVLFALLALHYGILLTILLNYNMLRVYIYSDELINIGC